MSFSISPEFCYFYYYLPLYGYMKRDERRAEMYSLTGLMRWSQVAKAFLFNCHFLSFHISFPENSYCDLLMNSSLNEYEFCVH